MLMMVRNLHTTRFYLIVTLLLLLSSSKVVLVDAADSFVYDEDFVCGYPFAEFQIQAIECGTLTTITLDEGDEWENPYEEYAEQKNNENGNSYTEKYENEYYDSDEPAVCSFGDVMAVTAQVTIAEPISRYMKVILKTCFEKSNNYFWSPSNCKYYNTVVDQRYSEIKAIQEEYAGSGTYVYGQNSYKKNQEEYTENPFEQREADDLFLPAGTYTFTSRFMVPEKKFPFQSGSKVTAYLTVQPKENYLGPHNRYFAGNYVRYQIRYDKTKTSCVGTFHAVYSEEEFVKYRYGAAAAVTALVSVGALVYVARKRKLVAGCLKDGKCGTRRSGGELAATLSDVDNAQKFNYMEEENTVIAATETPTERSSVQAQVWNASSDVSCVTDEAVTDDDQATNPFSRLFRSMRQTK